MRICETTSKTVQSAVCGSQSCPISLLSPRDNNSCDLLQLFAKKHNQPTNQTTNQHKSNHITYTHVRQLCSKEEERKRNTWKRVWDLLCLREHIKPAVFITTRFNESWLVNQDHYMSRASNTRRTASDKERKVPERHTHTEAPSEIANSTHVRSADSIETAGKKIGFQTLFNRLPLFPKCILLVFLC